MLKKILIVDDSPATIRLIADILAQGGYQPVGISDPRKIEEAIEEEQPSVILLDVVMPDRNGFQACRELKGHLAYGDIPLILVSSRNMASDKFWGQQLGADGYVGKPFTAEELLEAVGRFA